MSRSDWEVVIGLEVHAQLNTASKIFSGASTAFGAEPNRQASAVDIALPGVLLSDTLALLGCRVFLELFVRVTPGWTERPALIHELLEVSGEGE